MLQQAPKPPEADDVGQHIKLFLRVDESWAFFFRAEATPTHRLSNQRGQLADGVQELDVVVRSWNVISWSPVWEGTAGREMLPLALLWPAVVVMVRICRCGGACCDVPCELVSVRQAGEGTRLSSCWMLSHITWSMTVRLPPGFALYLFLFLWLNIPLPRHCVGSVSEVSGACLVWLGIISVTACVSVGLFGGSRWIGMVLRPESSSRVMVYRIFPWL